MPTPTGVRQRHRRGCKAAKCRCPWEYHLELATGPDGKRRQISKSGFMNATDAKEARAVQERIYRHSDIDLEATRITIAEWLDRWLAERTDPHSDDPLAETTSGCYRQHIDSHLVPIVGKLRLRDLKPVHISGLRKQLRAKKLSEATVKRVCATLGSSLTEAVAQGLILANPMPRAPRKRGKRGKEADSAPKVNPWSLTEWQKFQAATVGDRFAPLYLLAADAGMRRGELCGLRWQDVDLEKGTVTVSVALVHVARRIVETSPKSDAGHDRIVYLTPATIRALKAWRAEQREERLKAGPAWGGSHRVFTSRTGEDLIPRSVYQRFVRTCRSLGLRPVRFHDLRHLSATLGAVAGESPLAVSKRLGHADPAFTMRTYQHVWEDQAAAAAQDRGRLMATDTSA